MPAQFGHPAALEEVRLQGRYRLDRSLASQGAMVTWLALDEQNSGTPAEVVIKLLSYIDLPDWKQLERFEREAKLLAQLRHPGLPRLIDHFATETQLGLVLE